MKQLPKNMKLPNNMIVSRDDENGLYMPVRDRYNQKVIILLANIKQYYVICNTLYLEVDEYSEIFM